MRQLKKFMIKTNFLKIMPNKLKMAHTYTIHPLNIIENLIKQDK